MALPLHLGQLFGGVIGPIVSPVLSSFAPENLISVNFNFRLRIQHVVTNIFSGNQIIVHNYNSPQQPKYPAGGLRDRVQQQDTFARDRKVTDVLQRSLLTL